MTLTAETITDEQIRELRAVVRLEIEALIGLARDCDDQLARAKRRAHGLPEPSDSDDRRARCAAAWNARHGGTP